MVQGQAQPDQWQNSLHNERPQSPAQKAFAGQEMVFQSQAEVTNVDRKTNKAEYKPIPPTRWGGCFIIQYYQDLQI